MADYTDQHVGSRTRSKMQNVNILNVQNLLFPLHGEVLFQGHRESQAQDLQLGLLEYKVYHNIILNTKSQIDFDHLLQLHMLDKTDKYKVMPWEFCKTVEGLA
jgi:hypothetical protein